ncbi:Nonribosomal peptide synthetase 12 [Mycena venus]|uniref:Nonribosomal peptide synthetase 12 n=1 Tax=Mycena venus TaxID=2733690 RepID=A0A8H6X7L5_9AGAR|nr:Nonribosomal peptide synthetase 12 [Mycena venus]
MTEAVVTFPDTLPPSLDSAGTSTHSGDVEKNAVSEAIKFDPAALELPAKRGQSSFTRWLHHIAFTYYRKIFTLIFVVNLVAFIVFVVKKDGHPLAPSLGSAASANLMVTLLFRQENFVNLAYEIAVACPHSAPFWLRRRLAKVFHYGGAHSGAGVAAVVWYIMYTAVITSDYIADPNRWALANLTTSYILVTMFVFMLAAAHPTLRRKYHNHFEAVHRYSGWIALATFWMHSIFSANQYRVFEAGPPSLGRYLISTPNFWTLCISTSCTIISWARLRRHDVDPEVLSSHVIRLHFKYRDMPPFYGLKISNKPLLEWHAFATIPDDDGSGPKGFSVVVSNAGDWTRECIANPPTKLWIRGYPMHGLLYTSKLFKKIVVVATGSGIGPCLSLFYADVTPRRVFWSTPNPLVTYGESILRAVKKADPDAWIWDTRTQGRPDMVSITYKLVVEAQAEAVFVISNPKLTRRVVYGMESRGIAAYGAIFDS